MKQLLSGVSIRTPPARQILYVLNQIVYLWGIHQGSQFGSRSEDRYIVYRMCTLPQRLQLIIFRFMYSIEAFFSLLRIRQMPVALYIT